MSLMHESLIGLDRQYVMVLKRTIIFMQYPYMHCARVHYFIDVLIYF